MDRKSATDAFAKLLEVVKQLRTPETGCPWDLEQDHLSLRPYLIEEAYEVLQTIDRGQDPELCDELGDLLLQVVLHAQVAEDRGAFRIEDVVKAITEKMIRRHPHVFGDMELSTSDQVLKNWEKIKSDEKKGGAAGATYAERLADIPETLPSLLRAQRIGEKAAKVHFDWETLAGVLNKVREEFGELEEEIAALGTERETPGGPLDESRRHRLEHELGDVLFSLTQLARWTGISAEDSLRTGTRRFLGRFTKLERLSDRPLTELSADEFDALWNRAKTED